MTVRRASAGDEPILRAVRLQAMRKRPSDRPAVNPRAGRAIGIAMEHECGP